MRDEKLHELTEHFTVIIPLLQRQIFDKMELPDFAPKRLPPASYRVLMLVDELGSAIVSELSARLIITRSNMTPLLDKLEKHELIKRRPCEQDRRNVFVEIAPAGAALCRYYQEQMAQRFKDMLGGLEDDDLYQLSHHMGRFKSILIKASGETRA